jgi:3-phosphoinositide dependent protein kinase-1
MKTKPKPSAALSLADFDLVRRLGSGSFAEVFLATPRRRIPGVAWPAGDGGCENGGGAPHPPAASSSSSSAGWPAAVPPCAVALKVVDKHLLTRTPGAVDAVRRERDVMDALGGLAAAAEAMGDGEGGGGGGGGGGDGNHPSTTPSPAALAALARLPPGLHPRWAATRTIRLLFTFQDAASLYFGLEACPGGDLFSQLAARRRLRAADALPYLADAVAALAALAAAGVTHRDVKPENFMLDGGGRLKLGDFGCAAWVGGRRWGVAEEEGGADGAGGVRPPPPPSPASVPSHPLARAARAPSFVGTADYVPPEALGGLNASSSSDSDGEDGSGGGGEGRGHSARSARGRPPRPPPPPPPPPFAADAWALGCVAYQLLVGVPPFRAATEWLTYQRIAAHDLRWPAGTAGVGGKGGSGGSGGGSGESGSGRGGSEDGAAATTADSTPADPNDDDGSALPPAAVDLIARLLDPDPFTRLGGGGDGEGGGGGMEAVMAHSFFASVDWGAPGGGLAAPPPVPPPPPSGGRGTPECGDGNADDAIAAEEDEVDWELASLAAALPVVYCYDPGQAVPPGATGVVGPSAPRGGGEEGEGEGGDGVGGM